MRKWETGKKIGLLSAADKTMLVFALPSSCGNSVCHGKIWALPEYHVHEWDPKFSSFLCVSDVAEKPNDTENSKNWERDGEYSYLKGRL